MDNLIIVLKAAADRNRIRILKMFEKKSMCVCELAAVLNIRQLSVSTHLSILKNAGLIQDERNGQWIDYCLCREKINKYSPVIQATIMNWLNDDPVMHSDRKKAKTLLCRHELCKKGGFFLRHE